MKPKEDYTKLRGGYYTPCQIAEFIAEWAIRTPSDSVLEPSCGDGSFLGAVTVRCRALGADDEQIRANVLGVELDDAEARKSAQYGTTVVCNDFFTYYQEKIEGLRQFDVVVGNPPFIRYQHFTENYRSTAFSLMDKHGFHPNRLTNVWLPFLLLSCKALKPAGRVGMVIPAELFQVDYAAEARQFLSTFFDRLTLVTFRRLVFDDIQQEVILLLGEMGCSRHGILVVELDDMADLTALGQECLEGSELKTLDHSRDKWVKYYLSNEELALLKRLSSDKRIANAADLFEVNVGLVSGENDFFVVNKETVERFGLQDTVVPVISRSDQLKGVKLTTDDYESLAACGKNVFFFEPGCKEFDELTEVQKVYIQWGEGKGYNKNYKCRIRPKWYHVPQSWRADAFLIRQAHLYPRMILNERGTLVTDTLHKVRFLDGVDGGQVAAAFLNSYTLALSETLGRSYGGGVLTFEPGEMRRMRIPMQGASQLDLQKIDRWQRYGEIDKILDYTDAVLLRDGLGLSEHEMGVLRSIWHKMCSRRMSRKSRSR